MLTREINLSCGGDAKMPGRAIFISYRRADAEGEAGRLFDDLVRTYGDASVFMDVSGIEPGVDFRKAIEDNVSGCGVLLAVIGPGWATVTGSDGVRRLDNPDDYVRLEIATALARGIPVIPVLVHDSHMPVLDQLPDNLKDLRYRNSVELTHARWNSDVALLINALKNYVAAEPSHPTETIHATVPVQLPAPQAPAATPVDPPKSRLSLYWSLGAAAVILLAIAIFAAVIHGPSQRPPSPSVDPSGKPRRNDTCLTGYVWRGADPTDHVCVTPEQRRRTAEQNAAGPSRIGQDGMCMQGFVWREADPTDHVCVSPTGPGSRKAAANENAEGPSHALP
jgi:hypothetical protein